MTSSLTPEVLLAHLDRTGAIKTWLRDVAWTLCRSGDALVDLLISTGFMGDPCERAELVLEVLEAHGWIVRGALDPLMGRSGLAFSKAWPSVTIIEKRRCWAWVPGPALGPSGTRNQ